MRSVEVKDTVVICNLQKLMSEEKLNITQLSNLTGVAQNTIRGYLQNRFNRIDCEIAVKLCNHFGVSFGEMFEIVGDVK